MKRRIYIVIAILFMYSYSVFSNFGDTLKIRTIEFGKPKYGWFDFPDSSAQFSKILLNYKLRCPCGEWDYVANVFVEQYFVPSFRVDSSVVEEFSFMFDTSWTYKASIVEGQLRVDSFPKKPRLLEFYEDPVDPSKRTSFRYVWDTYYRYKFSGTGEILDSTLIAPDSTIFLQKRRVYYSDNLTIKERYEIMRYITPYGIGLNLGSGFTWVMDVSDFKPLLSGKVYINAPNQQEDLELTFDFIEGIPEREVKRIEKLWTNERIVYDKNFENIVAPRQIILNPNEHMARLKVIQTGHGFGGNEDNCCEFCRKTGYVKINDTVRYSQEIWRKCAENPVFPQGGTWLFNRTNWCPGAEVQPYDYELTPFIYGDNFKLDYDMDYYDKPYTGSGNVIGNWYISSFLITYGKLNFQLDAELEDIVAPTTKDIYRRLNPISTSPVVVIKNRGAKNITKLNFEYGIVGATQYSYEWNGNVESLGSVRIKFPSLNCSDWETNSRTFSVKITKVNGQDDEYPYNNTGFSEFSIPPSYYNNLIINLQTNNYNVLVSDPSARPYSLEVRDSSGRVILSGNDYRPSARYSDSLDLPNGCYEFHLYNLLECGLGFWYFERLYGLNNGGLNITSDGLTLYTAPVDFGASIHHYFRTSYQPTVSYVPDTVNFNYVKVGETKTIPVVIKPLNIKGLTISNPKIVLGERKGYKIETISPPLNPNTNSLSLNYGDSVSIFVSFTPPKDGKFTSSLTLSTNDLKMPQVTIPLIGNGSSESSVASDFSDVEFQWRYISSNMLELKFTSKNVHKLESVLYNSVGMESMLLFNDYVSSEGKTIQIDLTEIPPGIYFAKLSNRNHAKVFPIPIIK